MKRIFPITLSVVILFGVLDAIQAHLTHRIYDLQNNEERPMSDVISDLKRNQIVIIGEHHNNKRHHKAQLNVDYIKKAFGGHAHGKLNFTYFCEAQLVWDTVMAINALDYLNNHPNATIVVLTGAGHAQKNAIPRQIRKRSNAAHAVILPEIKGLIDPETVDHSDADYIMLDL